MSEHNGHECQRLVAFKTEEAAEAFAAAHSLLMDANTATIKAIEALYRLVNEDEIVDLESS